MHKEKQTYQKQYTYQHFGKSFQTKKDQELIKLGKEKAKVEIEYKRKDREGKITIEIGEKKTFYINGVKQQKISDIIGKINLVLFYPDNIDIIKEEIDVITEEIENLHNLESKILQEKEQINSDIKVVNERITNNDLNYKRFEEEILDLKEKKKTLEEEVKQKEEKKINLFANKEKFEKELEEKQKELDELNNKLSEKEKEIEEHKKVVEQCIDTKFEKSTELSTYATNLENLEKREKTIKIEIQQGISELDGIKFTKEDIAKVFYDIENKRKETLSKLEEASKNKEDSMIKIKNTIFRF